MSQANLPETSSSAPASSSTDTHSLYSSIFLAGVYGSNIAHHSSRGGGSAGSPSAAARNCIKPWDRRSDVGVWTESLEAGHLVINIPFGSPVKVSSVLINQGAGQTAPHRLRIYVNRPNGLGLEDVFEGSSPSTSTGTPSSGLPQADFLLREQDQAASSAEERVQEYPLGRFAARFASVNSLHVVLSDAEEPPSRVYYLSFRGTAPKDPPNRNDRLTVQAEDAASNPMGKVRESAGGASAPVRGSSHAADGTGGQAR
ncbi:hypothetical protein BCV69DRAFT_279884 [Microstroma glucosiphilum]|uniref:PITH domain-containing protein n=1 Tax=Pseudomicrostroma glucosiphilum TaxID=1684307 RepID=A0A316UGA9_9BASI|nr:hypothetical protein BCV69DRAFT_279884 [Pseudomicrostroma glucosiphilum]PWN23978.1 hypothetical protein BCV69DRAFT_279884 [Pseudomicrostroma glucosiphilum]